MMSTESVNATYCAQSTQNYLKKRRNVIPYAA